MSAGPITARATLADLMRTEGRAELIGGRIVRYKATGHRPNQIAGEIYSQLKDHVRGLGVGSVYTDSMGFAVPELSSGRASFSPDASYYDGPPPIDEMDFVSGPSTFAVEVRSKSNFGPAAEAAIVAKRGDYFEAGTKVVWDVDPIAGVIHSYRADNPTRPTTFVAGQQANAEPAVPGWEVGVDELFG
jgi:Uma2 family endonuclease